MILLHISDAALREAVIEQIAFAKLGDIVLCDKEQAWVKKIDKNSHALIVIEGDDNKIISMLPSLAEQQATILVLGGNQEHDAATETFAKPVRLGHVITRLRYYLETAPLLRNRDIIFGPYRLEPQHRRLCPIDKKDFIKLTEKETALLVFLGARDKPATRQEILAAVWGYDERIDTHTLETHIYQLRRKLDETDGEWLINASGAYSLRRG